MVNVFYDDLTCKECVADIAFFKQSGFTIVKEINTREMSVNEAYHNLYYYLDDYRHAGFKFINFPDELIQFRKNHQSFACFGRESGGYFVLNDIGQVYMLCDQYSSSHLSDEFCFVGDDDVDVDKNLINQYQSFLQDGIHLKYVNQNLLDFVNSYSFLLSAVYVLKGNFKAYDQSLVTVAEREADILQERLYAIDKNIINDFSYWGAMIENIREVNIPLNSHLLPYKLTGRMPIYGL